MSIVLQFVEADDPASKLIQFFERGWPSHVDAVLPDGRLLGARSDEVGGAPAGVAVRTPDYEVFVRKCIVTLDSTLEIEHAFYHFLDQQFGKPYDKLAIVAFGAHRDWRQDDAWFCSELIAAALETSKFLPHPLANPSNEITPRDLLLIVSPWGICS